MLSSTALKRLKEFTRSLTRLPRTSETGIHFNRNRPSWAVTFWHHGVRKYRHMFVPDLSSTTVHLVLQEAIRVRRHLLLLEGNKKGGHHKIPPAAAGCYGIKDGIDAAFERLHSGSFSVAPHTYKEVNHTLSSPSHFQTEEGKPSPSGSFTTAPHHVSLDGCQKIKQQPIFHTGSGSDEVPQTKHEVHHTPRNRWKSVEGEDNDLQFEQHRQQDGDEGTELGYHPRHKGSRNSFRPYGMPLRHDRIVGGLKKDTDGLIVESVPDKLQNDIDDMNPQADSDDSAMRTSFPRCLSETEEHGRSDSVGNTSESYPNGLIKTQEDCAAAARQLSYQSSSDTGWCPQEEESASQQMPQYSDDGCPMCPCAPATPSTLRQESQDCCGWSSSATTSLPSSPPSYFSYSSSLAASSTISVAPFSVAQRLPFSSSTSSSTNVSLPTAGGESHNSSLYPPLTYGSSSTSSQRPVPVPFAFRQKEDVAGLDFLHASGLLGAFPAFSSSPSPLSILQFPGSFATVDGSGWSPPLSLFNCAPPTPPPPRPASSIEPSGQRTADSPLTTDLAHLFLSTCTPRGIFPFGSAQRVQPTHRYFGLDAWSEHVAANPGGTMYSPKSPTANGQSFPSTYHAFCNATSDSCPPFCALPFNLDPSPASSVAAHSTNQYHGPDPALETKRNSAFHNPGQNDQRKPLHPGARESPSTGDEQQWLASRAPWQHDAPMACDVSGRDRLSFRFPTTAPTQANAGRWTFAGFSRSLPSSENVPHDLIHVCARDTSPSPCYKVMHSPVSASTRSRCAALGRGDTNLVEGKSTTSRSSEGPGSMNVDAVESAKLCANQFRSTEFPCGGSAAIAARPHCGVAGESGASGRSSAPALTAFYTAAASCWYCGSAADASCVCEEASCLLNVSKSLSAWPRSPAYRLQRRRDQWWRQLERERRREAQRHEQLVFEAGLLAATTRMACKRNSAVCALDLECSRTPPKVPCFHRRDLIHAHKAHDQSITNDATPAENFPDAPIINNDLDTAPLIRQGALPETSGAFLCLRPSRLQEVNRATKPSAIEPVRLIPTCGRHPGVHGIS
eukprot:GHVT01010281.1.p1 GENE.GHVT01010281.1~~GHVT01010281.1.p1  ORF type:complete len:1069 (-),score=157.71 GHVT01010281.1:1103-4309(-)